MQQTTNTILMIRPIGFRMNEQTAVNNYYQKVLDNILPETVNAKAIVAFTASGKTAFRISRERPDLLLIVMTPENIVRRKLSLLWGARSFLSKVQGYEAAIKEARQTIKINKLAKVNENIIVVAGMPFGIEGTTNSIRVVTI